MGSDSTVARKTSLIKSIESKETILNNEAPNTFRIPISFVRCTAVYDDNPINPRQEMMMASTVKMLMILPNRLSSLYWLLYRSSRKKYSKALPGKNFLKAVSAPAIISFGSPALILMEAGAYV